MADWTGLLPGAEWLAFRQRRAGRHKRFLAAERAFHEALLEVGPDDICIDCGANVGYYTAFMARTGATVHAFEPDPLAFRLLSEKHGEKRNVALHEKAVGVRAGTLRLHRAPEAAAGKAGATVSSSLLAESGKVSDGAGAMVDVIDFPAFLRSLARPPRVVKMDIEGAEVELLEVMIASGQIRQIGRVFVETHEKQMPSLRSRTLALVRRVQDQGFDNVNLDWS